MSKVLVLQPDAYLPACLLLFPPTGLLQLQVVTFDAHGVSGHPNHLATHAGVLHWWGGAQSRSTSSSSGQSNLPQLWQLETVALPRKYLALMDAPLSWLLAAQRRDGLQISLQPQRAWAALLAHGSQMVW